MARLRAALDDRLADHTDLGLLPEQVLGERFFPGGQQPVTEAPVVTIDDGFARAESAEGASIEIRVGRGPWRLYAGPIQVIAGEKITARAQRYGWKLSNTVKLKVSGGSQDGG